MKKKTLITAKLTEAIYTHSTCKIPWYQVTLKSEELKKNKHTDKNNDCFLRLKKITEPDFFAIFTKNIEIWFRDDS